MKIVPPTTFEEKLNMLKTNFLLILDKYEGCKKTCRLRGCPKCEIFSKLVKTMRTTPSSPFKTLSVEKVHIQILKKEIAVLNP